MKLSLKAMNRCKAFLSLTAYFFWGVLHEKPQRKIIKVIIKLNGYYFKNK